MFKNTLQILVGIALAVQLTGCIFLNRDRHGHRAHHEHNHDAGFDIRIHGE